MATAERRRLVVRLQRPANDLVQEEIGKQVGHLSRRIGDIGFTDDGMELSFSIPASEADPSLEERASAIAANVQRSLRSLQRRVVFRSKAAEAPRFRGDGMAPGIRFTGPGQAALSGLPLRLFEYFDRAFEEMGREWNARPLRVPTLIPIEILARCDYLRSFPHIVTFGSHLPEDAELIERFRARHQDRSSLDAEAAGDMSTPEVGLAPAVCYHAYALHAGETVPAEGITYGACGKCFRYESSNMRDLRRLWDFTLREIIFIGGREDVLRKRERGIELMGRFLDEHGVAAEIRTASDPFFIAPDAMAKAYFQLSSDTKYEVAAHLPDGSRVAIGSLNYHSDFFGKAFDVAASGGGPMHSVCIGFGLERWVYAFLAQHGADPQHWPAAIRTALDLA